MGRIACALFDRVETSYIKKQRISCLLKTSGKMHTSKSSLNPSDNRLFVVMSTPRGPPLPVGEIDRSFMIKGGRELTLFSLVPDLLLLLEDSDPFMTSSTSRLTSSPNDMAGLNLSPPMLKTSDAKNKMLKIKRKQSCKQNNTTILNVESYEYPSGIFAFYNILLFLCFFILR